MMCCIDATRLMSEEQERPLTLTEKIRLKVHVMMCSGCRNFRVQMRALRDITRAYVHGEDERAVNTTTTVRDSGRD